ncbi:TPA: YopX family protein [Streptococcus suis]
MTLRFRFFGKVADGKMRMVSADCIDFENRFIYYSYRSYTAEGDVYEDGDCIDFSDVVLMQSTGLFDKNGKEIFEGDVVKFNDTWAEYDYEGCVDGASEGENFTEIIRTEDGFSFGRTKIPESSLFDFLNDEHMKFSEIVKSDDFSMAVVGNIYKNPELVEG